MRLLTVYIFVLTVVLEGCKTTATSMLIADNYDSKADHTTLTVIPYGNISLPGQWTKTSYNSSSRQHFFRRNSDSLVVAVTKNPKEKYPFFKGEQSDFDFINSFYKWESDYRQQQGFKTEIVKQDSVNNFIIWKIFIKDGDNTFLYGLKKGLAYNLVIVTTKMNDDDKTAFLEKIYLDN